MKRVFINTIFILLLSLLICVLTYKQRITIRDLNVQKTEIEALRVEIAELRDQVEDRALKEDVSGVYNEAAANSEKITAYEEMITEISDRLLLVEENQQFYKNVWREYFGLKRELP